VGDGLGSLVVHRPGQSPRHGIIHPQSMIHEHELAVGGRGERIDGKVHAALESEGIGARLEGTAPKGERPAG